MHDEMKKLNLRIALDDLQRKTKISRKQNDDALSC